MRFEVDIRGLDSVEERLEAIDRDELLGAAEEGLAEGTVRVANGARAICPVDTGALRRSISSAVRVNRSGVNGEVSVTAPYAARVEMGGAGRPARPFLYPAFKANQTWLTQRVTRAIRRRMEER